YLSDTTFELMVDYYSIFSGLSKQNIKQGNEIEQNSISKAARIIYSSTWARNSAVESYSADPAKISVIDFGANLLYEPSLAQIEARIVEPEAWNLLFLGVDWLRKGGDIAYKTYIALK